MMATEVSIQVTFLSLLISSSPSSHYIALWQYETAARILGPICISSYFFMIILEWETPRINKNLKLGQKHQVRQRKIKQQG